MHFACNFLIKSEDAPKILLDIFLMLPQGMSIWVSQLVAGIFS